MNALRRQPAVLNLVLGHGARCAADHSLGRCCIVQAKLKGTQPQSLSQPHLPPAVADAPSDELRASVTQLGVHMYRAGPGSAPVVLFLFTDHIPFRGVRFDVPRTYTYRFSYLFTRQPCKLPACQIRGARQASSDILASLLTHQLQEQPLGEQGWTSSKIAAYRARAIAHIHSYVNKQDQPRLVVGAARSSCTKGDGFTVLQQVPVLG